jgi:hypothetical protein
LLDILEDSETAAIRQADAEDQVDYYLPNAVMLESQCENLQMELSAKIAKLRELEAEEDQLITMINTNYESIPGIGIR